MTSVDNQRSPHPLYVFFTGLCMGSADVVPGVSGGTIALIMGVYHQVLAGIRSFNLDLVRDLFRGQWSSAVQRIPWQFLIPLGLGIATAILSLAEILSFLMAHHESLLFAFFFGLVAASVASLTMREHWSFARVVAGLAGAMCGYVVVGMVPVAPGHSPWILFASGAISICAMILPGISGSFLLLVLGQYAHCVEAIVQFVDAVRTFDVNAAWQVLVATILPFGAGAVLGLMMFARLLGWLLSHHQRMTLATLIGLMLGSMRRLWPFKDYLRFGEDRHGDPVPLEWHNVLPSVSDSSTLVAIGLCLLGFMLICLIDHIYDRRNPVILLLTTGHLQFRNQPTA